MANMVRLSVALVPPRFHRWWRGVRGFNQASQAMWGNSELARMLDSRKVGESAVVHESIARRFMEAASRLPGWDEDEDPKPILWEDGADVPENEDDDEITA